MYVLSSAFFAYKETYIFFFLLNFIHSLKFISISLMVELDSQLKKYLISGKINVWGRVKKNEETKM